MRVMIIDRVIEYMFREWVADSCRILTGPLMLHVEIFIRLYTEWRIELNFEKDMDYRTLYIDFSLRFGRIFAVRACLGLK